VAQLVTSNNPGYPTEWSMQHTYHEQKYSSVQHSCNAATSHMY